MPVSYYISFSLLVFTLLLFAVIFKRSGDKTTAERLIYGASLFIGISIREMIHRPEWYYREGIALVSTLGVMFLLMYGLRFVKERRV